jgi:hypothetical protein
MMRRKGAAGLVAAGMLLIGAAPGQAQELPGARYLGTYKHGIVDGTVDFKVSPDGTRLAEFRVINEHGQICAMGPLPPLSGPRSPGLPIENHAFAGALSPYLSINGSFTAPDVASGSFDLSSVVSEGPGVPMRRPPRCPTEPVSWSAVGDATAPSLVMNARATQSRGQKTIKVKLSCPGEKCSVLAQGVVSLKAQGVARRFKLLSAGASDLSGKTTLRLAIPRRAHRAIRALGSDGTVTVKVRVTASDRFGNAASARQSVRLKP